MRLNLDPVKHTDLPAAFRLVRQVLKTQPRSFRDILSAGVQLYEAENPEFAQQRRRAEAQQLGASTSTSATITKAAPKGSAMARMLALSKKGAEPKMQRKLELEVEEHAIPPAHPWVSTNFFKRRILPVLSSQNLIVLRSQPTSSLAIRRNEPRRSKYEWQLAPKTRLHNTDAHWEKLVSGEHPGAVGGEYKAHLEQEQALRREQAFNEKRANRTDRDVVQWMERPPELTTKLQRMHLSTRRRRNRDGKEMRAIMRRYEYDLERGLDLNSEEGKQTRLAVDLALRRLSGYEGSKRQGKDKRDEIRKRRKLAAVRLAKGTKKVRASVGDLKGVKAVDTHAHGVVSEEAKASENVNINA
ncbi:hypothetical protein BCR39DRAFT_522287 [Naematelia encephala]|uniref:Uncharacterized protein n=1 Tax=Naematelia encephala TaxID=71784 RepID=A0A1Y2BDU3_9TREE|nr:hypothetical protein BCR39DRAFT_522287 [Naematelia encephala]